MSNGNNNNQNGNTKPKHVFTIREGKNGDNYWTKLGVAFTNRDGSLNVLLDALPHDARAAFTKFLEHYDARESSLVEARRHAPKLNYDVPDVLPGGFVRKSLHTFQFGEVPGVAATYDRGGEFLAVVFHRPVSKEHYGPRREYPCMIGRHKGHKVGVGEWKLVHLTDPTTCHCLLSKLDEETELPAVMAAIAPEVSGMGPCDHDH